MCVLLEYLITTLYISEWADKFTYLNTFVIQVPQSCSDNGGPTVHYNKSMAAYIGHFYKQEPKSAPGTTNSTWIVCMVTKLNLNAVKLTAL